MAARSERLLRAAMRLYWTHIFRRRSYQKGSLRERRLIDIRYACARALRDARRKKRITQAELARCIATSQPTISHIECAWPRASLDVFVEAMIALDAGDETIAAAFNAGARKDVQFLRDRIRVLRQNGVKPMPHPACRVCRIRAEAP